LPGFLLHQGATVICLHTGPAQPLTVNSRVLLGGQPAVTFTDIYAVTGCILPTPPTANGPCLTGQWVTSATRVKAGGIPVLLQDSQAICAPSGTGLNIVTTQMRVKGT
jgi:uncharacterized Zn-binding protein involved in type VI secretion